MADQILLPAQVLDNTGNPVTATDNVRFFAAGTTTPLTVYADEALSINIGTAIDTDAGGRVSSWPVFVASGVAVKVVLRDAAGVTLDTFDPCPTTPAATSAAASLSFAPVAGNAATDVQTAIANNTAATLAFARAQEVFATTNSGNAYTVVLDPPVTARQAIRFTARVNASATGAMTLDYGAGPLPVYSQNVSTPVQIANGKFWGIGTEIDLYDDGAHLRAAHRHRVFDPASPAAYAMVQADAAGKMPAIDGSTILNITAPVGAVVVGPLSTTTTGQVSVVSGKIDFVEARLTCTSANLGYTVGQVVPYSGGSGSNTLGIWFDADGGGNYIACNYRLTGTLQIPHATTGAMSGVNSASWALTIAMFGRA